MSEWIWEYEGCDPLRNWLPLRFRLRFADGSAGPWFSPDTRQPSRPLGCERFTRSSFTTRRPATVDSRRL
ncbi:hypothetical protein ACIBMX_36115 [Streptomyces phaeochromogenes]|uniref:hypothetical protein n=1 Tax=Streptomyces phaeochromogenes TaxID=1923 RepID=UPI0033FB8855